MLKDDKGLQFVKIIFGLHNSRISGKQIKIGEGGVRVCHIEKVLYFWLLAWENKVGPCLRSVITLDSKFVYLNSMISQWGLD